MSNWTRPDHFSPAVYREAMGPGYQVALVRDQPDIIGTIPQRSVYRHRPLLTRANATRLRSAISRIRPAAPRQPVRTPPTVSLQGQC
ncbi:MAG: hypothetical protein AAGA65_14890 [Actinomycetota bacterium]